MLAELAGYMGAAWLAYTVRYDDAGFPDFYRRQMWLYIAFIPALRVGVNRCLGTYDLMWRYVTLEDAAHLAASLAPVTLALCALRLGLPPHSWQGVMFLVPLSIIALEYLLALGVGLGLRCLRRMIYVLHHHYQPLPEGARRVLILGAGMLGLVTAQDLRQYPHISLVGFLDDDPAKERRLMAGRRVLGNSAHLERAYARHKVTDVMICAKSMDAERRLEIHQRCSTLKIKVHMVPSLDWVLRDESDLPRFAHVPASLAGQRGQEHD
jgi:FlaA1/EpsC-like NDP-sugar epimerase